MPVRIHKGSWWIDFSYAGVRFRKRSPVDSRAGALDFEVFLRREITRLGSPAALKRALDAPAVAASLPTYAVFAERWLREYAHTNNKESEFRTKRYALRNHLVPTFGALPLDAITVPLIEQFKSGLRARRLSAKTINNKLTILRRSLATAVEWGLLEHMPRVQFLKTEPPPFHFLEESEVAALVDAARGVFAAMILIAARTGLRFGELAGLHWDDVDLVARRICVRRSLVCGIEGSPKNHRVRYVGLTRDAAAVLGSLPQSDAGYVFTNHGRPVTMGAAQNQLARACERAKLPRIGWHVLRHTFASQLAIRGASLQAIRGLLGHSTITMTLRYAHLSDQALQDTIALLEPSGKVGDPVLPRPLHSVTETPPPRER